MTDAALRRELRELRARVDALERQKRALDDGRALAIATAKQRGANSTAVVLDAALLDIRDGKPDRGRAKRIVQDLGGSLSESQVRRILRTLFSARDSALDNAGDRDNEHDGDDDAQRAA